MDTLEILDRLESLDAVENGDDGDGDIEEDQHKSLLTSLGVEEKTLDGKKDRKQRSEATNEVSIFSLNPGSKVKTHELLSTVKDTVRVNVLKKNLSKLEDSKNRLSSLLPKITADKVEREAAYEESTEKVSKWDDVVRRNRRAEHLSFPLKHENMQIHTVDEFVQKFKPKTPLETQIYALLKGNKYEENPETGLSVAEEEALRSVSLQEARRRRAELQKHRALLSYHEAKNRRLAKIKSRRHLRIIRKQKEKKSASEFEDLAKNDPEQAAEKVKLAQKTRAEERAVLRHRQGSKWAKNRMLIAKYNEMTKVELQEQRKLHSELVQKNLMKMESSDEEDAEEEAAVNPLVAPTSSLPLICFPKNNPWLRQVPKSDKKDEESADVDGSQKENGEESERFYNKNEGAILGLEEVSQKKASSDSEESDEEDELKIELSEIKERKKLREKLEDRNTVEIESDEKADAIREENVRSFKAALSSLRKEKSKIREVVDAEDKENLEKDVEEEEGLEIGLTRRSNLNDLEKVLETENEISSLADLHKTSKSNIKTTKKSEEPEKLKQIDPNKVFTLETGVITSENPTIEDDDDNTTSEDANRMTIKEAFADDDVLADFMEEKKKTVDSSKPKARDLTLPGWGEWGGIDIKPSRRKKKKFFIKPNPPPPRKDSHLGAVIINENRDAHIAKHQLKQIPHGFKSYKQYERSIRQPIGKTWNTPATFKNLTLPKVSTVMGAIIDPMDEADAFDDTKTENRKRAIQDDGHIGFDDVIPTDQRRFKRKKGNKKHKK